MTVIEFLAAGGAENLWSARTQMALSLGWHIVFACFGIAFPAIVVFTEWLGHRRGDAVLTGLAHTWAKAMGVLFAAGAVSGTLLSFEMGILWPGLMDRFGEVFGFPFVLEGFAFFVEAIFVGVYLFGWDRLSPRAHMLSALPMVGAGIAGAFFVVSANAWMNNPTGFRLDARGEVVDARPWAAMFGPSTWPQFTHMWLAAFMVTGFLVASVYAVGMLRGRRDGHHRAGLLIPLTVAAIATPVQIGVGDWIANTVADNQPAKLAAMEGQYETTAGAGLSIGGIYQDNKLRYALEIPYGLSLLIHHDPDGVVPGSRRCLPTSGPRSTWCTSPTTSWSPSAWRCWHWRRGSVWCGGAGGGCREPPGSCGPPPWPVSRRWWRWRRAGSPPRSAGSRGSSTASCAPRTRSAPRPD